MKTSLERIRVGAVVLLAIVIVAIVGFHSAGYDWVGALWMAVITITGVGFSERSQLEPAFQIFTVVIIVFGMSAAFYTVGGLIQMIFEGELANTLGQHRATRTIEKLKDHVIICGFGRIGRLLADDLHERKRSFVVIDSDREQVLEAQSRNYLSLDGDAEDEEVLLQAGVQRASTIVTGLPNDAANVFITLTSRNLNPTIQIIARAEHPTTEKKLRQAGANRIVMPAVTGAQQMLRLITRPSTADFLELLGQSSFRDVAMDEVRVRSGGALDGSSVAETGIRHRHRLLVVAVKTTDGAMVFGPGADYSFHAGDVVIVMGRMEDIQRFREACEA